MKPKKYGAQAALKHIQGNLMRSQAALRGNYWESSLIDPVSFPKPRSKESDVHSAVDDLRKAIEEAKISHAESIIHSKPIESRSDMNEDIALIQPIGQKEQAKHTHIDDWLDSSMMRENDPVMAKLALFFEVFRFPAWKKWKYLNLLPATKFKCVWTDNGVEKTMYLIGCSRMGDIWLSSAPDAISYEVRTYINLTKNWELAS